ncbi:MAG: HNH endonuclease [Anaerolineae bacterium]|nr:HNH endonuclease [Anaerolineae bacterium]
MAFDKDFANALVETMANAGWHTVLPTRGELPNPLHITFSGRTTLRLIIYARRLTRQSSDVSNHHRPLGEMHLQLLFDGDRRGAGERNRLLFRDDALTLLLGFYQAPDNTYVVAACDPQYHQEYAYSASVQVKNGAVQQASEEGIAFYIKTSGETVVVFQLEGIAEYIQTARELHSMTTETVSKALQDRMLPPSTRRTFAASLEQVTKAMPGLRDTERRQRTESLMRYVRNQGFREGIVRAYRRCAICGFQYDYILEAAHIIPVAEGGTDTYDNGLALCPTCHEMFDKGYILVDRDYGIHINTRYAEEFDQAGLADSLNRLKETLRRTLWLPDNENYHPAKGNLQRTFEMRR